MLAVQNAVPQREMCFLAFFVVTNLLDRDCSFSFWSSVDTRSFLQQASRQRFAPQHSPLVVTGFIPRNQTVQIVAVPIEQPLHAIEGVEFSDVNKGFNFQFSFSRCVRALPIDERQRGSIVEASPNLGDVAFKIPTNGLNASAAIVVTDQLADEIGGLVGVELRVVAASALQGTVRGLDYINSEKSDLVFLWAIAMALKRKTKRSLSRKD